MKYLRTYQINSFLNKLGKNDTLALIKGANGPFLSITIDGEKTSGIVARSLHNDVLSNKLDTKNVSISWVETQEGNSCWMIHPTGTNTSNVLLVLK